MKSIDLNSEVSGGGPYDGLDKPSVKYYQASTLQKVAGIIAFGTAVASMVMTAIWMANSQTDKMYLGGLNWDDLVFNWHPVLMVSGMVFSFVTSLLTYRLIPLPKFITKALHVFFHTAAICCISIGLTAVFTGNNYTNKNTEGVYYPNFYSLHSMLGITAVSLYGLNYLIGIVTFLIPRVSADIRKSFLPHHVFIGTFALFAATFAVETGIMELATELGCSYDVTSADWNPAENYHKLPDGCRLANGIGVMVLITMFFCSFALFGPSGNTHTHSGGGARASETQMSTTNNTLLAGSHYVTSNY